MLRIIFYTIVIILFLSFFGISLQGLFESAQAQSNFGFVLDLVEQGWDTIWTAVSGIVGPIVELFENGMPS